MSIDGLLGPLGSHQSYISHVALANASDYFHLKQEIEEKRRVSNSDKFKLFRYLINAIESINNIPEWIFFDHPDFESLPLGDQEKLQPAFRKKVMSLDPCLPKISAFANACKHRRRWRGGTAAEELSDFEISARVLIKPDGRTLQTDLEYWFSHREEDDQTLQGAWRFWIGYLNRDQSVPWPPVMPIRTTS